jgi:hypothetical protein
MTRATFLPIAVAALAVLYSGSSEAQVASSRPLLRVESTVSSPFFNTIQVSDQFIFNDGLVIRTTQFKKYTDNAIVGCELTRFMASAGSLASLKNTLNANRVGLLEGECIVATVLDDFVSVDRVTWFGRGERRNSYRTWTANDPETCGGEAAIARKIGDLGATATDFTRTVVDCPKFEGS